MFENAILMKLIEDNVVHIAVTKGEYFLGALASIN
jgi:hypothetical protein